MSRPVEITVTLAPQQVEEIAQHVAEILRTREAPPPQQSPFLTADEAAELMRCRRRRIYDLVADGRLTRLGEGRRLLVSHDEVIALASGTLTFR